MDLRALWQLCKQICLVLAGLGFLAVAWQATLIYNNEPPSRLPLPTDPSECVSQPPDSQAGSVHIRRDAEFDIVVYGATGFSGRLVTDYLSQWASGDFTFAIAGKDWGRLDALDAEITAKVKQSGHGRETAAILVADSKDLAGLRKLVRKAKVILAVAGPYTKYGSRLLEICAEEGTHYVDKSEEIFWMRRMIEGSNAKAQFSGAKVVQAAGFVSLPFDLGVALALQALDAALGAAAANVTIWAAITSSRGGPSGGSVSSAKATRKAALKAQPEWSVDPYLLAPKAACKTDATTDGWGPARYEPLLGLAGTSSATAHVNGLIVRRSLSLLGRRGVSYGEGQSLWSFPDAAFFQLRHSVTSNPSPRTGPPVSAQDAGGWTLSLAARDEVSRSVSRVEMHGRGDPGYRHGSALVAETGLCLLDPVCHRSGAEGGLHTPTSGLDPNALLRRLQDAGHTDGQRLLQVTVQTVTSRASTEL